LQSPQVGLSRWISRSIGLSLGLQTMSAAELHRTAPLKLSLTAIVLAYAALGSCALALISKGGHKWIGDAGTLTTVLAVLGAVFAVMSRFMLDQCLHASLQRLAHLSLESAVPMASLHKHDIATRGNLFEAISRSGWRGPLYRCGFPIVAILMSATLKKAFAVEHRLVETSVRGDAASLVDPVNILSRVRGTTSPGAIIYNTTTSIGSGQNPNQTSWTYFTATTADPTGLEVVEYFMPSLPRLVASGSGGYTGYVAGSVPSLVSQVQCSANKYIVSSVLGSIQNSDNRILVGYMDDGRTPIVQVTSIAANWSCLATVANATGNATYTSDGSGTWFTSSVNMQSDSNGTFFTTRARWAGIPIIISDSLGATRSYSGWSWGSGSQNHVGYSDMLVSSRLSFASAILSISEARMKPAPEGTFGTAYQPVQFIVLQANWALVVTTVLLWLQSVAAFLHLWGLGEIRFDLSMLQLMALASPPRGVGAALLGHCSGLRTKLMPKAWLAVRSSQSLGAPHKHLTAVAASVDANRNVILLGDMPINGWTKVQNDVPHALYGGESCGGNLHDSSEAVHRIYQQDPYALLHNQQCSQTAVRTSGTKGPVPLITRYERLGTGGSG
jgi:hypothetical protein